VIKLSCLGLTIPNMQKYPKWRCVLDPDCFLFLWYAFKVCILFVRSFMLVKSHRLWRGFSKSNRGVYQLHGSLISLKEAALWACLFLSILQYNLHLKQFFCTLPGPEPLRWRTRTRRALWSHAGARACHSLHQNCCRPNLQPCLTWVSSSQPSSRTGDSLHDLLAYYIGQGEVENSLLQG